MAVVIVIVLIFLLLQFLPSEEKYIFEVNSNVRNFLLTMRKEIIFFCWTFVVSENFFSGDVLDSATLSLSRKIHHHRMSFWIKSLGRWTKNKVTDYLFNNFSSSFFTTSFSTSFMPKSNNSFPTTFPNNFFLINYYFICSSMFGASFIIFLSLLVYFTFTRENNAKTKKIHFSSLFFLVSFFSSS